MDELMPTLMSLRTMIAEMNRKNLDLKRITKTSSLLLLSGLSGNSIPGEIIDRTLEEQRDDGGWVSVLDTLWNCFFLKSIDEGTYRGPISRGLAQIEHWATLTGLWGRSQRDRARIPVTGILFYLFPGLAAAERLQKLEQLWLSEKNSLTYKAAYVLMAFKRAGYQPQNPAVITDTLEWLSKNQRADGGFAPWRDHPVQSDVFCTGVATLGLLQYREQVNPTVLEKAYSWLVDNRLNNGIWPYHEIEDGASWGLYAMSLLIKYGFTPHG